MKTVQPAQPRDLTYFDASFQSTHVEVFFHSEQSRELFKVDRAVSSAMVRKSRALELFAQAENAGLSVQPS